MIDRSRPDHARAPPIAGRDARIDDSAATRSPTARREPIEQGVTTVGIEVRNLSKRYGSFQAVEGRLVRGSGRPARGPAGPFGVGQEHDPADHRRAGAGRRRQRRADRRGRDAPARPAAGRRLRLPALRPVPPHDGPPEHRVRPGGAEARPEAEIKARVDELLELVQLSGYAGRYPSQLSGGQRQRVALARALAPRPKVLLLDEPFGALDAKVRDELRTWLRKLHDEVHVTSLFVTHDQQEAFEVADQIVVLNKGRVQQMGPPQELYEQPGDPVRDRVPRLGQRAPGRDGAGDGPARRRGAPAARRPRPRRRRGPRSTSVRTTSRSPATATAAPPGPPGSAA